jgi:GNAT superfamily N-acetyltransferase
MRKALPEDVPRLVELMAEFYAEGSYPLNHQRAAEAFTALLANEHLGHVWFIRADSRDVGHIVVTVCFSMEYGGLIAFVDDLFVQPAFRRAGLGTAALAAVKSFCAKRGVRAMFVETGRDNIAAQTLYRRAGFVDTDRELLALRLAEPTHIG